MDSELKVIIGFIVVVIVLMVVMIKGSKANYQEYYNECMGEAVLSKFECKQAAHGMAYGE
tara:strand:- start:820 stop:999 length:180 start_codon:yes stop_codon:yes gene_type:complete